MPQMVPLRERPALSGFKKGDYLVLFGELFSRGYANGLVEEAERQGMTIIRSTVGRRDKDGTLRALNHDEVSTIPKPFLNIPLEAGFDMSPDNDGKTPVEILKEVKLSDWKIKLDFNKISESRKRGVENFRERVQAYMQELATIVEPGRNVLMAHLMAGGVPRAKIVMPLMNRVFKGRGDRYLSSQEFWESDIGRLCQLSFDEVTAETFRHMVELSEPIRKKAGQVSYTAYGYHGTEVLIDNQYRWTTYTPYLQGWAKKSLEDLSRKFHQQGLKTCVYNCPEILTNSSSIFQGVEVFLYMLLDALKTEAPTSARAQKILEHAQSLLKDDVKISNISADLLSYFRNPQIIQHSHFDKWPQHSGPEHMEVMLNQSEKLASYHKDQKNLISAELSEVIFEACGFAMFHDAWVCKEPVRWLGHDVVVRCLQT